MSLIVGTVMISFSVIGVTRNRKSHRAPDSCFDNSKNEPSSPSKNGDAFVRCSDDKSGSVDFDACHSTTVTIVSVGVKFAVDSSKTVTTERKDESELTTVKLATTIVRKQAMTVLALFFVFTIFFDGIEVGYGALVLTFAVE